MGAGTSGWLQGRPRPPACPACLACPGLPAPTFSRISRARLHSGSASLYLPRLPYRTARLFNVAATWGVKEWSPCDPGPCWAEALGPWSYMGRWQPSPPPTLTHSWVVLAQCLLADGQGIIEQVGSLLVLVLVSGGRQKHGEGWPLALPQWSDPTLTPPVFAESA